MIEHTFSVLHVGIRITADCQEMEHGLEEIAVRTQPEQPVRSHLDLQVLKTGGAFIIQEDHEAVMTCPDPEWTTVFLHQWINRRVCEGIEGLQIHGGCGTFRGKRFILCGEKGAGKTTLLCHLMFDGVEVHSDETVLLDREGAQPFPGKFHLKEGTVPLVSGLKPLCRRRRSYPALAPAGESFYFFDPAQAGFEWGISKKKVDAFFYLEPERAGESQIAPCPKFLMVRKLLGQTLNLAEDPRSQIRTLCEAVDAGVCHDLRVNALGGGARMIKEALRRLL